MKKTLSVLIMLIMIVSCVPGISAGADSASVYEITAAVPDAVVPGQTFDLSYTLTNTACANGISGGSIVVTYDDSVLEFNSVSLSYAPSNWTVENWTKSTLTGVIYIVFWDETETSNSLTTGEDNLAVISISFTVSSEATRQQTSVSIVESYEIQTNDYYYTEILDAGTLDPVEGTYGSASIKIENGLEVSASSGYTVSTTDYTTDTLHITNASASSSTTLAALLSNIENNGTVKVYDRNGAEVTDQSKKIGTGFVIKTLNPDTSAVISETTVLVKGDINGDGVLTSSDYLKLYRYVKNGSPVITGADFLAGRIVSSASTSSNLTAADYLKLKRFINASINSL